MTLIELLRQCAEKKVDVQLSNTKQGAIRVSVRDYIHSKTPEIHGLNHEFTYEALQSEYADKPVTDFLKSLNPA